MSKAIRSSRRARRGAGGWLRTTMAPAAGADIEQPDCVAAGVGGPSSSHRARVHGWASRWGRVRSATLRTSRDGRPRARFAPAFARGCGRPHTPGRRARLSSAAGAHRRTLGHPHSHDSGGAAPCFPRISTPAGERARCASREESRSATTPRSALLKVLRRSSPVETAPPRSLRHGLRRDR
jgi:hypothetical protein